MKLGHFIAPLLAVSWLVIAPAGGVAANDKKGAEASSAAAKPSPLGDLVDINSATTEELEALPGIGKAYSAAIIKNRPYRSKHQLIDKHVIPSATYAKIKDRIIAKQK